MAKKKTAINTEPETEAADNAVTETEAENNTAVTGPAKEKPMTDNSLKTEHIYVGVSLPGIPSGTVFKGKIPEKLNEPFVRELVIPLEDFTAFIKKKSVTDSREAFCYRKSAEYAKTLQK